MAPAWSEAGKNNTIDAFLIWFIPLLAIPVLLLYCFWRRLSPAILWALALGQCASFSWLNWSECLKGGCTTPNPLLITLSGAAAPPVWFWFTTAVLCQIEYRLRRNA
jgi:hypothetical protein